MKSSRPRRFPVECSNCGNDFNTANTIIREKNKHNGKHINGLKSSKQQLIHSLYVPLTKKKRMVSKKRMVVGVILKVGKKLANGSWQKIGRLVKKKRQRLC